MAKNADFGAKMAVLGPKHFFGREQNLCYPHIRKPPRHLVIIVFEVGYSTKWGRKRPTVGQSANYQPNLGGWAGQYYQQFSSIFLCQSQTCRGNSGMAIKGFPWYYTCTSDIVETRGNENKLFQEFDLSPFLDLDRIYLASWFWGQSWCSFLLILLNHCLGLYWKYLIV